MNRTPTQGEVFNETHTRKANKTTWVDAHSTTTYVISKLYTSFGSYLYIQYNINLILVSINCRLSTKRLDLSRLRKHPKMGLLLSAHRLARTWCDHRQSTVLIWVASMAQAASIMIPYPLHLWLGMRLPGPSRWRMSFAFTSMLWMIAASKIVVAGGTIPGEAEDGWEEGGKEDGKKDHEADVEILLGSVGQKLVTSSFSMAISTRPAVFIVFFFFFYDRW